MGKNGLLFAFKGKLPIKAIMILVELDALPIQEINPNYAIQIKTAKSK